MSHPRRLLAVACSLVAALGGACSGGAGEKKAASVRNGTTTSLAASPPTTAASGAGTGGSAASSSGAGVPSGAVGSAVPVAAPDGSTYSVKVTVNPPGGTPPCAVPAQGGRQTVGFTLVVTNNSAKDAPSPRIGLLVADPQKIGSELAAMTVDNTCIDFLLRGDTMRAGASVSYPGSVSNITPAARLILNMVEGTIGAGGSQEAFALVR